MQQLTDLDRLAELVARGDVAVLTGAGLSTESGIPDYRGATGAAQRRHSPMTYQEFTGSPEARQRYWARSHVGWRTIGRALPNPGHVAVARLEQAGLLSGLVTQNVDGLHAAAGSRDVVELHGALARVVCLGCGALTPRSALDARLAAANAAWSGVVLALNPDGDALLDDTDVEGFTVVDCAACGGVLKPDVVFFGETVPADRVAASFAVVDRAASLLVLGSSLHVMSGYRFVLHAVRRGIPVALVNLGPTRGDRHADLRLDAPLGAVLPGLVDRVMPRTAAAIATPSMP
ncbi:NAD-dependent SIR2 family protein deacetylase [Motilibacter rhizosphaerae]|uniref:NAD-dependent protein deacetylase n=1 Tax=Motilibacter rhizosphaerae TaxID=598652 RepID=A0A4Q7NRS4_9ACTN|nr:NAD-dependent protein deacetylase [Motilibacter rhizosphaerae]RZS89685.1 NAD-dependent SIR2 family protein deacetylase [Motilibacter rhizosphaerae]